MSGYYIDKQIQAIRDLHRDILSRDFSELTILELLEAQSQTLQNAHSAGRKEVLFHLACWSLDHIGLPHDEILGKPIGLDQARASMAREYGYSSWSEVETQGNIKLNVDFETSIEHLVHGQLPELRAALRDNPKLATQKSQFGHQGTLLHYVGANGVESQRQVTPYNAASIAQCLIDAGADVNSIANIYGGAAVLGLVETSAHPANAGVTDAVVAVLKAAGAR